MLVKVGSRVFKRSGGCIQCAFCCRLDYTNLKEYAASDQKSIELCGKHIWPVCPSAAHDIDGVIICKDHSKSDRGCRLFPWHPDQLSNVNRDDLPRIPLYMVEGEEKPWHGLPPELEGKAKFVGWAPFSNVCPYRFEDVTESMGDREKARIKPAENPIVSHEARKVAS